MKILQCAPDKASPRSHVLPEPGGAAANTEFAVVRAGVNYKFGSY